MLFCWFVYVVLVLGQQHTAAKVLVPEFVAFGALALATSGVAVKLEAFGAWVDGVGYTTSVALEGHASGATDGGGDALAVLQASVAWALLNNGRHTTVLSVDVTAFTGRAATHDTLVVAQAGARRAGLDELRGATLIGFKGVAIGAVLVDVGSAASVGHHAHASGATVFDLGDATTTLLEHEAILTHGFAGKDTTIAAFGCAGRALSDHDGGAALATGHLVTGGALCGDIGSTSLVGHHTRASRAAVVDVCHTATALLEGKASGTVGAIGLRNTASIFER